VQDQIAFCREVVVEPGDGDVRGAGGVTHREATDAPLHQKRRDGQEDLALAELPVLSRATGFAERHRRFLCSIAAPLPIQTDAAEDSRDSWEEE